MKALTPLQLLECTRPAANAGVCEVWLISAGIDAPGRKTLEGLLSEDERSRAGRFRFEEDRARFVVARGALRWILASWCSVPADCIQFRQGKHGKPELLTPSASVEFNVSHSGEYAMIAVTSGTECGADIEVERPGMSEGLIAAKYFCRQEVEWLSHTDAGFVRLWATKEAVIKALGGGLTIPLCDFDVTGVLEGRTSTVTIATGDPAPRTLWLSEIQAPPGYAAAIATLSERRIVAGNCRLRS